MHHNYLGRIVNSPNEDRIPAEYCGTLSMVRGINKVAKFISQQGWNVIFERGSIDCAEPYINNVIINSKKQKNIQLYTILHEAGHVVLFSKKDHKILYPSANRKLFNGKRTRTVKYKVDVVREEIAAWDVAELLIKKLNISIDIDAFKRNRNKCLKSYFEWTMR